jgi:hypothetical protein
MIVSISSDAEADIAEGYWFLSGSRLGWATIFVVA